MNLQCHPCFPLSSDCLTREIDSRRSPRDATSSNKLEFVLLPGIWRIGNTWIPLDDHYIAFCQAPCTWCLHGLDSLSHQFSVLQCLESQVGSITCVEATTDPCPSFPFLCMNWPNLEPHNPASFWRCHFIQIYLKLWPKYCYEPEDSLCLGCLPFCTPATVDFPAWKGWC